MNKIDFGTLSARKIFFKVAIPGILSMVFSSISIIVDGIFVGQFIGGDALAAVNLIFPIIMIAFALADMIAVGSSVKVGIALGANDKKFASETFSASLIIILSLGVVVGGIGLFFGERGAAIFIKDELLSKLAFEYAFSYIVGLPFFITFFATDNFLRICGKAKYSMVVNVITALINIILDILFIGVLRLGIFYAGLATAIGLAVGALLAIAPFVLKKLTLKLTKPRMKLRTLGGIVHNGSAAFLGMTAGSVISIIVNGFLLRFGGGTAVAAYGIVMYIDSFLIAVLMGMIDSVQPAVSFNKGAGNIKKCFELFKITSVFAFIISLVVMLALLIFPTAFARIFSAGEALDVVNMTKEALILFAPSYLFTWFVVMVSSFLTNFDKPKQAFFIMIFRSIVFPIIVILIASTLFELQGVFATATITALLCFVLSFVIWKSMRRGLKEKKKI